MVRGEVLAIRRIDQISVAILPGVVTERQDNYGYGIYNLCNDSYEVMYCILYCIVLYLYIYIALLAVHTNQERFQSERSKEKRAVLRERKEALGSPVNKVDRVEGRSWFQSKGPMIAKDHD